HLHGGIARRPLLVRPSDRRKRLLHASSIHSPPRLRCRDRRARRIVGGGRRAESDHAIIRLRPRRSERRQASGAAHHDDQQPGRERVERAEVSHATCAEGTPHRVHHVVGRGPARLRDQRHAGDQPAPSLRFRSTRSICCAWSSPRSSSKRISGVTRRGSSLASWARRKRAALVRPSSDLAFSASVPITLTRTRACDRSPDTSTAVTVTNPTRGSRTFPVRNAATVWRMASATRSGRWVLGRLISEEARARVDDAGAVGRFDQAVRLPQHALRVAPVGGDHAHRQLGALPQVVMRRLRRRYIEPVVEAVVEALEDVALVLERVTRRKIQLPRHDPHGHAGVSERAISSMRYASIRSPTFRSLKFSTPIPHSNPSRTSRTSSLKRLSEDSVPSYTSTPSRTTRTRAVRGMTPERTKLAAIVPTSASLNNSRTSASPRTTSFRSGASRPAIAAFTS